MSAERAPEEGGVMPRALAVLPARLGSTRLERKMLLAESGLPLVVHSARNAARCPALSRVVVATDAEEIRNACAAHGVEAVLTAASHPSGSDRVNEVVQALEPGWEVVVNVQADEPELLPAELSRLVAAFADGAVEIATLATPLEDHDEHASASVVKVVRDSHGDALYFSRAPIPSSSHARADAATAPLGLRHVGVYAYRPAALARFCGLAVGDLERRESLEQLRWLEDGGRIRVLDATRAPRGIDTRADYDAFLQRVGGARQAGTSPPISG